MDQVQRRRRRERMIGRVAWTGLAGFAIAIGVYLYNLTRRPSGPSSPVADRRAAPPAGAPDPAPDPAPAPAPVDDQARAELALRGRVHLQSLSRAMAERGIADAFEVSAADASVVVWVSANCSRALLEDLGRRMRASFRSYGFRAVRCGSLETSIE